MTDQKAPNAKKRRVGGAIGRLVMRVPRLRRAYIRRTLKFIDKSQAKGKPLSPELTELSRNLSRLPKNKRADAMEQAIESDRTGASVGSREMRRAAVAAQRKSGQRGGGYRPGMPPRSAMPKVAGSKKPRSEPGERLSAATGRGVATRAASFSPRRQRPGFAAGRPRPTAR